MIQLSLLIDHQFSAQQFDKQELLSLNKTVKCFVFKKNAANNQITFSEKLIELLLVLRRTTDHN